MGRHFLHEGWNEDNPAFLPEEGQQSGLPVQEVFEDGQLIIEESQIKTPACFCCGRRYTSNPENVCDHCIGAGCLLSDKCEG